ncbi:primosomal protein [Demequina aurantiaca]|uniref:primosomal protein n=1 Tax=Demequina aurantiaca TaxID=676200 RepID=UPI003D3584AF
MSTQPREALQLLVSALETHLEAVASRRSATDAAVDDAYDAVAETFETYEEALDVEFGEAVPLVLEDDEEYDEDEHADEDEDSEGDEVLDDEEIDPHAEEDEDDMDDDLDDFDLR